jgi:hypothetical protein
MSDEAMELARQAEDFLATDKDMPEAEKQLALQVQEVWLLAPALLFVDMRTFYRCQHGSAVIIV